MDRRWPSSHAEIAKIQSVRKRRAVENAMRAPFFRDRLKGIDLDRLDEPAVWTKIPLLTKDQLRQIPSGKEMCARSSGVAPTTSKARAKHMMLHSMSCAERG